MENASRKYSADKVRQMIKHEEEKYAWEFMFLAANIDAVETAEFYGIRADRAANYAPTSVGTNAMYDCVSDAVGCIRSRKRLKENWKEKLES